MRKFFFRFTRPYFILFLVTFITTNVSTVYSQSAPEQLDELFTEEPLKDEPTSVDSQYMTDPTDVLADAPTDTLLLAQKTKKSNKTNTDTKSVPKEPTTLADLSCEDQIKKYNDEKYALRFLAGLYANRACRGFKLDFKQIPSNERTIYAVKFEELGGERQRKNDLDSANITTLRKRYLTAKTPEAKLTAFKNLRQRYRNSGRRDKSMDLINEFHKDLVKHIKSKDKKKYMSSYFEVTLFRARALWNANQNKLAITILKDALKNLESEDFALHSKYFILAKIHEEESKFDEATEYYDLAIDHYKKSKSKDSQFDLGRVQWSEAWMLYKNGFNDKAEKRLKDIIDTTQDPTEKTRAQFFLAKLMRRMKKEYLSRDLLISATKVDDFTFYSLAAHQELGRKFPSLQSISKTTSFPFDSELKSLSPKDRNFLTELGQFKEPEMLEKAAFVLSKNEVDLVNIGIFVAEKANRFQPVFTGFSRVGSNEKRDIFVKHPTLIFPTLYEDKVKEMAKKTDLPASLIFSIIKQESAFNPMSRSHADAFGVMQVIPALARDLVKRHKIKGYSSSRDLYDPLLNIELGSYELQNQVKRQKGQLSYVAAAYNAGPTALRRWINRESPITDIYEFIESMPYEETKTYIKLIARNMLYYERILEPKKAQNFPKGFVEIPEN